MAVSPAASTAAASATSSSMLLGFRPEAERWSPMRMAESYDQRASTTVRTMTEYRIEHDTMGDVQVPADARWQAQTQRAVDNFPISGLRIERSLIAALA